MFYIFGVLYRGRAGFQTKISGKCFEAGEMDRCKEGGILEGFEFSPIQLDDREISVRRLPYGNDGEDTLKQLRIELSATTYFAVKPNSTTLLV